MPFDGHIEPREKKEIDDIESDLAGLQHFLDISKENLENVSEIMNAARSLKKGEDVEVDLEFGDQVTVRRNEDGGFNIDRGHLIH